MNSVANGKILPNTAFANLFIQPAAGDAGGALGAALCVHHERSGSLTREPMLTAALGPGYDTQQLADVLARYQTRFAERRIMCSQIGDVSELEELAE